MSRRERGRWLSGKKKSDPGAESHACPKCGSPSLADEKKGFNVRRSLMGVVRFGAPGMLAGLVGRNDTITKCLSCGHQWQDMK
ncbi:hypothetical protein [Paenibacillus alba]|uniref:Transcription initiation factor TFIIIB n=1 Tax=Paenibacillus alba TaxID=1197127 RepID=A0ABU6G0P4_9BACL|nr:hypothetical protein [Paenibacillus alba]MEC0227734.1 hypothetical protein [Paenibacillus alba]